MDAPPPDQPSEEGVLSHVVDKGAQKVRALPRLYLGPQLVFAHREASRVIAVMAEWVDAIKRSSIESVYTLRACRIGDATGLYGRDMFARSLYKRKLQRLGVEFDDKPFVTFRDDHFESDAFGLVRPDFVILDGESDEGTVMRVGGAMLPFVVVTFRLGAVPAVELSNLVRCLDGVPAMSADEPAVLLREIAA